MTIEIDREKAAVYGITVDQIRQELYNAFGIRQVATIYTPIERLPGHPGDASRSSRPTRRPVEDLPEDQRRRHGAATAMPAAACWASARSTGMSIPLAR